MFQKKGAFIQATGLLACTLPLAVWAGGARAAASAPPPPPPVATTIANYDFNAGSSYATLTPALASGTTSAASSTQSFATGPGTATDASAFTANATAGRGMTLLDSSGNNTQYFQFQLGGASLPSYRHYKVYVQAFRTANAATALTLAYSTNGTTFTMVPTPLAPGAGVYASQVFDLSSVTALDHQGTIYFRLLASGASIPNASMLIDNFQVQADVVGCPTAFTVDNTGDAPDADPGDGVCAAGDGACTLRAALAESNALTFCSAVTVTLTARGTIPLAGGLPTITRPISLLGPGANLLAVSGNNTFRLVNILLTAPGTVTINDLAFTGGGKSAGDNATALEFNNNGTLLLNRDEFHGNTGSSGSSVIFSNAAAQLTMTGSTIRDNAVEHVMMIGNTPFSFVDSTIASNTGTGAAIFVFGGTVGSTVTGSTITNNNQGLWHVNTDVPSSVTIRGSIFSQNGNLNLRRSGPGTCANNGIVSGGFNLIDDNSASVLCATASTDLIGSSFDPQLSPLGYYGGTTQTRLPALASPAIDKGLAFGQTIDQRGSRRAYDKPGVANAAGSDGTDIGAVELGFLVNSLADTGDAAPDGACDNGSGLCTLREAIQEANATTDGDTISFAAGLTGTIVLGSGLPTITRPITILGPGANVLAIGGNNTFRLVNILLAAPGAVTINDLAFTNGGKGTGENAVALEFNNSGTLVLNRDEFWGNSGPSGSSVIFSNAAAGLTLMNSTVRDNAVEHVVVIGNTPFQVTNSTIASNTGTGAAIFVFGGTVGSTVTGSTITNNNQGLWHANMDVPSSVTIRGSIFSQNGNVNLRRTGTGTCANNGIVSGGFNLIDNDPGSSLCASTPTDLIGASFNPQLAPLGSYGGTTRTRALLGGSPAIDQGHRFGASIDQRGQARPFDNPTVPPATAGDNTDIGAFELQAACGPVSLSPGTLPNWNTITTYGQQLTASGASAPFAFSIVSGSLPPGVTMTASGALSGTPTATGTFTFTVLATSANGCYGIRTYTITIGVCTTISVTPASVPFGIVGTPYSQSLSASGGTGPYTFSAIGTVPAGVTLSSGGGLSGTPTTPGSFPFTATATASNGCTGAQAYTAAVLARPTGLALSNASVAENNAAATTVGTFSTTDADSATFTYTLVSGAGSADNTSFTIAGNQLQTNTVFDVETKSSYSIRVRTTDPDSLTFEQAFTITVGNVNETPTDISLSTSTVAENNVVGATVGTLATADPDAAAAHTYTLAPGAGADDNGLFAIAGNALQINTAADFESKSSYSVRVRSTDQDGLFFEKTFAIGVTDVNEPPAGIALSASTVAENNAAGATVGTLSTADPDAGAVHTYTLVPGTGGDDNALFAIAANALQISAATDFETKASYSVRVRSTDQDGLFFEKAFVIGVANVNEPPSGITLSSSTVPENNAVGTAVGTLSTADPDAGAVHTYTLVSGTGGDDNGLFAIAGNALQISTAADFETKASYSVRVRSTDQDGLFFEKAFVIGVTNVNEAPTDMALSAANVSENNAAGATVGTLSTTDPDAGAVQTYTLVPGAGGDDNALFAIGGNALQINAAADFEIRSSYSVRVRSTDQGGLFVEKAFVIGVINVNEAPADMTLSASTVAEKSAAGTTVGTLSTADPDAGAVHTYTLVPGADGDDNALFAIAGNALTINTVADFETKSSYRVRVRSTDQGGLFFEKAFVIGVTNVNEPPTISDLPNQAVVSGTTIGPLAFSIGDPETAAGALTVTATSSNAALVPNDPAHLALAGTGAGRTLTITPVALMTGTTTITLTVSDGTATSTDELVVTVGRRARPDFDGDGRTDMTVYRGDGRWMILKSSSGYSSSMAIDWGGAGYLPVAGDYDGDGTTDPAVYNVADGRWLALESHTNFTTLFSRSLGGGSGARPQPGDYDGDGRTDPAIYEPATGQWRILKSGSGYASLVVAAGTGRPVPGMDFDGDGASDIAIFIEGTLTWRVLPSGTAFSGPLSGTWGSRGGTLVPGDYDGDGKADPGVYESASGTWRVLKSGGGYTSSLTLQWGGPGYDPAPGDYDGDGKLDLAIVQRSTGNWYVLESRSGFTTTLQASSFGDLADTLVHGAIPTRAISDMMRASDVDGDRRSDLTVYNPVSGQWVSLLSTSPGFDATTATAFGGAGYTAVPGDYDGDGKTDRATYQASTGNWSVLLSGSNGTTTLSRHAGGAGDVPVPGDYDGDGRTDFAVYNTTTGLWYALKSSTGYTTALSIGWGGTGYTAAPADFDGDGATDLALYVPATGAWYVLLSRWGFTTSLSRNVGGPGYAAVPGDFDGDGLADFAVYQTTTGLWYGLKSSAGYAASISIGWGGTGYTPFKVDADGDGRLDLAVYDGNHTWYVLLSGANFTTSLLRSWAGTGGIAVPQ